MNSICGEKGMKGLMRARHGGSVISKETHQRSIIVVYGSVPVAWFRFRVKNPDNDPLVSTLY
jgi:hypothetical protein